MERADVYIQHKEEYAKFGLEYYTKSEEIWNVLSHFIGGVFGVAGMIYMLAVTTIPTLVVAAILMGIGGSFPYFVSAAYHFILDKKKKLIARKIDHSSVCFIIFACGAPLTLGLEITAFNITAICICFSIALINVGLSLYDLKKFSRLELALDLVSSAILTAAFFVNRHLVPSQAKICYIIGSVFCLAGLICFGRKKQYLHTAFHILMVMGTLTYYHASLYLFP